jgi:hypothetical protein
VRRWASKGRAIDASYPRPWSLTAPPPPPGSPWHRALWLFYNELILRERFYAWLLAHLQHMPN